MIKTESAAAFWSARLLRSYKARWEKATKRHETERERLIYLFKMIRPCIEQHWSLRLVDLEQVTIFYSTLWDYNTSLKADRHLRYQDHLSNDKKDSVLLDFELVW